MRRHQRAPLPALVLAALLPLAACGDGGTEPEDRQFSIAGTYTLRTVNGQELPFTLQSIGGVKVEMTAGEIVLDDDLSYLETRDIRVIEDGVESDEQDTFTGTYSLSGSELQIISDDVIYRLNLSGETITEQSGALRMVWRR